MLKFWHFSLTRKTPAVTAMGVQAVIEYMVYPVEAGQVVNINGGLSRGTVQRYQWTQTSGPSMEIYNANKAVFQFIAPDVKVPTALTFTLIVTDTSNQTSQADVLVQVKPREIKQMASMDQNEKTGKEMWIEATPEEIKTLERANKETEKRVKKSSDVLVYKDGKAPSS